MTRFKESDLVEVIADNAILGPGMVIGVIERESYSLYRVFLFKDQYDCLFESWEVYPLFGD